MLSGNVTVNAKLSSPWCIVHHVPMEKHGINFTCPGHWATRVSGVSKGRHTFAERSSSITGKVTHREPLRSGYPWCIRCKRRMNRLSRRAENSNFPSFHCRNCGNVAAHIVSRWKKVKRDLAIVTLLKEGLQQSEIVRKLHVHHRTVRRFITEQVS